MEKKSILILAVYKRLVEEKQKMTHCDFIRMYDIMCLRTLRYIISDINVFLSNESLSYEIRCVQGYFQLCELTPLL